MQLTKIQNSIRVKNTFMNKAQSSGSIVEQRYWESLHNEAKSRLSYKNYTKATRELRRLDETRPVALIKVFSKMAYNKFMGGIYGGRAYSKFPSRFSTPDNILAKEERFYKIG